MKRSRALILLPTFAVAFATACGGSSGTLTPPDTGVDPDSGQTNPDARVIEPNDAGPPAPPPTLSSVTPGSGSERGGTRVTLRGTSFLEPAEVFFGDKPATSVVVLDEVSIAATTPEADAPGLVTVKVTTAGGTGELPEGFRYHRELLVLSISPARIPEEGGVLLSITGKGFDENTLILLDRRPLAGQKLIDAEHIEGYAPALEPGRPEIRAFNFEAETRRSDLLVVFGTPDVLAVAPGYGPTTGGAVQEIAGDGFEEATAVIIGFATAGGLELESGERVRATAPPRMAGAHDVTVQNRDAFGTLRGGYVAFDPAINTFGIVAVTPPRASSAGGDVVVVVGNGFPNDARVTIGGVPAPATGPADRNAISVLVPEGLSPGAQDVAVSSVSLGSTVTAAGALTLFAPIEVTAISPTSGPAAGGTMVTIDGTGFTADARVRIGDVELADVAITPTQITGTTVAGAGGPQDVVVQNGDTRGVLVDGFTFEEEFEVIRIDPSEGSVAGNTYVSVFGRGLSAPVAVKFGGTDGLDPTLENGSVIGVRTQPNPSGPVDVEVSAGSGDFTLPRAFTFYNPTLITGGAWGGPIEGSVNVAYINIDSGEPIPGAVIQLGYNADPRRAAVTDANGLATISAPDIRGAQTVTAGINGVEFVTFMEVDARNLTMFASAYPQSQGPDDPIPQCPMGGQAPVVRGRIWKLKSSLDPVTHPGWIAFAQVTYSQPNVFQTNPPQPAEQFDQVTQDGGEYEIVVMRAGTVAVYAIMYDFNPSTQEAIPRKMGIARQVPAAAGTVTEPIDISLDIELNQSVTVRLDNPPTQTPGPSLNAVFPYLNLQSEGVIGFPPAVAVGTVTLTNLPELATSQFFYMGGSFTDGGGGALQAPYSLTLRESGEAFENGLDLGPFVAMPANASPKPGQLLRRGELSWEQAGVTPDITTIQALDVTFVSGCCCLIATGDGTCPIQFQMCGGVPQQFARWSIYGQGGLESYVMPAMLSGLNGFDSPNTYFWLVQQAVAPRFNYREFIYNQFSPFFWTSWSVWFSQFLSKEETQ